MASKQCKVGARVRFFNGSFGTDSYWHDGTIEQIDKDKNHLQNHLHPYTRKPITMIIVRCDYNNMLYSVRKRGLQFL
jgi:hypothetical protein